MNAPAIILQRHAEPVTCSACARIATGIGIHEPRQRERFAWTCDDPECIRATKAITMTMPAELVRIETIALDEAAKRNSEPALRAFFDAFWDAGVRDLSSLTPEQVDATLDRIALNGAFHDVLKSALIDFGASIKASLNSNVAPF